MALGKFDQISFAKAAVWLATLFIVAGVLLAAWMIFCANIPPDSLGAEALKLVLQFLLITGVGGITLAVLSHLRDKQSKADDLKRSLEQDARKELRELERETDKQIRQSEREDEANRRQEQRDERARLQVRIGALQEIDGELSRSYRKFKLLKRQLRAQSFECARFNGHIVPPFRFERVEFEKHMGELLEAQIRLECLRDDLRSRTDLLDRDTLKLIRHRLRYAARFYHDVFEDFERGRVQRNENEYCVADDCTNIIAYLGGGDNFSEQMHPKISRILNTYFKEIGSGKMSRERQHELLDKINQYRKQFDPHKRRFRAIADDCFALASAELRNQIGIISNMPLSADDAAVSNRSYLVNDQIEEA